MNRIWICLLALAVASTGRAEDSASAAPGMGQLKKELVRAETEFAVATEQLFAAVEQAVSEISPAVTNNVDPIYRTVDGLIPLVRRLKTHGDAILVRHDAFLDASMSYGRELAAAPQVLDQVAARYRQYAKDEPFQDLKKRYLEDADTVVAIKLLLIARVDALAPQVRLVRANRLYVNQTVLYLGRLDELLSSLPQLPDGRKTEAFLARLKEYVDNFARLQRALQGLHEKVTSVQDGAPKVPNNQKARSVPRASTGPDAESASIINGR
jgi:hypothetical protein